MEADNIRVWWWFWLDLFVGYDGAENEGGETESTDWFGVIEGSDDGDGKDGDGDSDGDVDIDGDGDGDGAFPSGNGTIGGHINRLRGGGSTNSDCSSLRRAVIPVWAMFLKKEFEEVDH